MTANDLIYVRKFLEEQGQTEYAKVVDEARKYRRIIDHIREVLVVKTLPSNVKVTMIEKAVDL